MAEGEIRMKANIHPKYVESTVTCACGNTFKTNSTKIKFTLKYVMNVILFILVSKQLVTERVKWINLIKNMVLIRKRLS